MNALRNPVLFAALLTAVPAAAQGVVINEFSYDDSGTDDREFVELYNAGTSPVDISGWRLESNDESPPNPGYTIAPGTVLPPGGFWVLGSAAVANVSQVVGALDLWQDDMETLELYDTANNLVDAVVYEANKQRFTIQPAIRAQVAEGLWGNFTSIDGQPTSWSRVRDGHDTDDNGRDFRVIDETPGATNDRASLLTYLENFDTLTIGNAVPNWGGSFVLPKVIDPQQLSGGNTTSIPPSPQGGNALLCWDPAGGGNCAMLLTDAVENVVLECYAYFDATPEPTGEYETWSIGVQGTAPTYYNTPDLGGVTAGFTANGCTGVSLTYRCDSSGGTLYLIDHNNGGVGAGALDGPRILGQIAIQAGVNDGWQHLRLQAGSGAADAYFGGTFGMLDGQRMGGRIATGAPNGVYIGYREFLTANGSARPPTLDFLIVHQGDADVAYLGRATPHSAGTPLISTDGLPHVGEAAFGIGLDGLLPSNPAVVVFGLAPFTPPLDLRRAGAQPGSELYVVSIASGSVVADGAGHARLPLAVPAQQSLIGASLFLQAFLVDRALSFPLPIAQSEGQELRIGS